MGKLQKDDQMPDFEVCTADKQELMISEIVKKQKKTVFWVLRYIGCTVCRYDIHLLAQNYSKFLEKDSQVCVVLQSEPAVVRDELKGADIPFDVICDTKMEIYKRLEIGSWESISKETSEKIQGKAAVAESCGFCHGKYEGNEEQLPALFIVDEHCRVLYAHYAKDLIDMPDIKTVLQML